MLSFNSMKVRLKHFLENLGKCNVSLFQFHEGPIKTFNFEVREHGLIMFQFHEGPIKTCIPAYRPLPGNAFQFHEGPIKTLFFLTSEQPNCVSIP